MLGGFCCGMGSWRTSRCGRRSGRCCLMVAAKLFWESFSVQDDGCGDAPVFLAIPPPRNGDEGDPLLPCELLFEFVLSLDCSQRSIGISCSPIVVLFLQWEES